MSRNRHEIATLIAIFTVWKLFLLTVAYTSPGPGYDTSTTLLGSVPSVLPTKLLRWDAFYFTKAAQREYVFEQEWAFGWGHSRLLKLVAKLFQPSDNGFPLAQAWSGIVVSHFAHLISVLALYDLSQLWLKTQPSSSASPYLTAILHIFSPAGLFLSAPYAEALFSCLSFVAYSTFVRANLSDQNSMMRYTLSIGSALLMGLATTVRSNGLLNGLVFLAQALCSSKDILKHGLTMRKLYGLSVTGACGILVGIGYIIPQFVAYREFCSSESNVLRPWCTARPPSIYGFVQAHYWNTGLFKYWTIPNLPLFVFATPCLTLFLKSAVWCWQMGEVSKSDKPASTQALYPNHILKLLVLPQIGLAALVLSSYHVQIITRLSSGYPVWYWWIAKSLSKPDQPQDHTLARWTIVWMVVFAVVQGTLFVGFLPPA